MGEPGAVSVGLDGFNLAMPRGTGVATYARNLSYALRGLGRSVDVLYGLNVPPRSPLDLRETLLFSGLGEGKAGAEPPKGGRVRRAISRAFIWPGARDLVGVPITGRVISEAMRDRLPAFDRVFSYPSLFYAAERYFRLYHRFMPVRVPNPPAIMHWTYPLPLRLVGARNLYTLHDLVPLRLPFATLDPRDYYDRLVRACVTEGDHICTVSEASRNDIIDVLGAPPEKVTNTYQAVQPPAGVMAMDAQTLAGRLRNLFDLDVGKYFLFFGAIEPKKNLGRLIEAYLAADLATPLVIVGPRPWQESAGLHVDTELRLLEGGHGVRLKGAERVRLVAYLPADHLMTLARGARAVLFPSLYEGFGLPVLEAMTLGAPVMTSTGGSLPEVVGEAGLLVDPYDVGAMTAALRRLDSEPGLRAQLSKASPARAAIFSMSAFQDRLDAVHRRVLSAPSKIRS